MRRAPRARVQIDSTTTPTTGGPPALPPRDALEEDGAARAHPLPILMDMAPAGDAVADAGAADAGEGGTAGAFEALLQLWHEVKAGARS